MTASHEITQWLGRWSDGDPGAENEVLRRVLPEMRKMAGRFFRRERQNHTLQPTALVNEAYIQLIDTKAARWQDRSHFFAMAAHIMRHVLVDHARRRLRAKREAACVPFDESIQYGGGTPAQWLALNDALDALATLDPRKARVVELRFFGGMSEREIAAVLGVHHNTVGNDWNFARAWLLREMSAKEVA